MILKAHDKFFKKINPFCSMVLLFVHKLNSSFAHLLMPNSLVNESALFFELSPLTSNFFKNIIEQCLNFLKKCSFSTQLSGRLRKVVCNNTLIMSIFKTVKPNFLKTHLINMIKSNFSE